MKPKLFLFLLFFYSLKVYSQPTSDILIFSENSSPFKLWINGLKQNNEPQTQIELIGLPQSIYKAVVVINNDTIVKNLGFSPNTYTSFIIKEKRKNGYKLRFYDESFRSLPISPHQSIKPSPLSKLVSNECPEGPINFNQYQNILNQIDGLNYDEEKINQCKILVSDVCLLTMQAMEFVAIISTDYYRLEMVKFIAPLCIDKQNKQIFAQAFSTLEFRSQALNFLNSLP